ncbi:MAG: hypothetical protein ACR2N7_04180 [Acidimicrobiia bacterium]
MRRFWILAIAGMLWIVFLVPVAASSAEAQAAGGLVVNEIDLATAALAYDSHTDRIYASVPASSALYPNSIAVIDPDSASIEATYAVGSDPGLMAISDDGEWLYVFLNGRAEMLRWHIPTRTPDIAFPVGEGPSLEGEPGTPYVATDVAVVPGQPKSVAVASKPSGSTGPVLLAIYSDGTPLPDVVEPASSSVIEFGANASRLYAFDRSTRAALQRFNVSGTGVTLLDETEDLLQPGRSPVDIEHDAGLLYATSGEVIDGEALKEVGSFFSVDLRLYRGVILVEPSSADNVTYFIRDSETVGLSVEFLTFDQATTNPLSSYTIAASEGLPSHLIRTGSRELAYRTTAGQVFLFDVPRFISGVVTDRHSGDLVGGICVDAFPFGDPGQIVAGTETNSSGEFSIAVPAGVYQVSYVDCDRWDYAAEWYGTDTEILPVTVGGSGADASMALQTGSMTGLVDMSQGLWSLSAPRTDLVGAFFFGNPGDFPIVGDWDCDGVDTPGMYRQSDGYVYLRNSNTQGIADIRFFFGDPGDIPLAGDFNGDGCDTVSIFRPSQARVFIINELGQNDGGLGAADFTYLFGNPGDKPFVGDFDADLIDTVGLHRESTGLVYFRNSHTQGNADVQYIFGDPGDRLVAGNFSGFWEETPAVFRPSDLTFYIRHTNTQGNADRTETWDFTSTSWYPVAGTFGLSGDQFTSMAERNRVHRSN